MDVALISYKSKLVAVVEIPDELDTGFVRDLYLKGEGLDPKNKEYTADFCPLTTFETVRKKVEPCSPNMTIFWDANGNEVLVERIGQWNFKFNGDKWTLLNEAEMEVFLGRYTGCEGRDTLAKRLLALPLTAGEY